MTVGITPSNVHSDKPLKAIGTAKEKKTKGKSTEQNDLSTQSETVSQKKAIVARAKVDNDSMPPTQQEDGDKMSKNNKQFQISDFTGDKEVEKIIEPKKGDGRQNKHKSSRLTDTEKSDKVTTENKSSQNKFFDKLMLSSMAPNQTALAEPTAGTNTKVSSLTDSMNDVTKVEVAEEENTMKIELSETKNKTQKNKLPLIAKITLEQIVKIDLNDTVEEIPFI